MLSNQLLYIVSKYNRGLQSPRTHVHTTTSRHTYTYSEHAVSCVIDLECNPLTYAWRVCSDVFLPRRALQLQGDNSSTEVDNLTRHTAWTPPCPRRLTVSVWEPHPPLKRNIYKKRQSYSESGWSVYAMQSVYAKAFANATRLPYCLMSRTLYRSLLVILQSIVLQGMDSSQALPRVSPLAPPPPSPDAEKIMLTGRNIGATISMRCDNMSSTMACTSSSTRNARKHTRRANAVTEGTSDR